MLVKVGGIFLLLNIKIYNFTSMKTISKFVNEAKNKYLIDTTTTDAKLLKDIVNDLFKLYDEKKIDAQKFVDSLRNQILNNDKEVILIKGTWNKGTVEYNGMRINISISGHWWDENYDGRNGSGLVWYMTHVAYPRGYSRGFLINDDVKDYKDPTLKYYWVDKKGKEHDTKEDWEDNATEWVYDNPISAHAIPWKKVDKEASIKGFIKRWVELQQR